MEGMKYWIGTVVAGLNSNATRTVRGAISFNSSTHLPPSAGSPLTMKPVMLPPGCARFATKPLPIGSDTPVNTIDCRRLVGKSGDHGRGYTQDGIGPHFDQFFGQHSHPVGITGSPAKFDPELAVFSPTQLCERTPERCQPRLRSPIALRIAHQHADQPRPVRLLRARCERPRRR